MKSANGCLVAFAVTFATLLLIGGFFWLNFYDIHVRYRLTVEVQDGDRIQCYRGDLQCRAGLELEGPSSNNRIIGYAPTVDLGEKGMLFLTFTSAKRTPDQIRGSGRRFFCEMDDMWCLPFVAYGKPGSGINTSLDNQKSAIDALLRKTGLRKPPFEKLPQLVRFQNINDRRTELPVSSFDLPASFGPGVELKRVTLELTNAPFKPPPDSWLQWLQVKHQNTEFRGYESDQRN